MFHVKHWRRTETANLGTSKSPSFACASEIVSCETFPHPMFCSLLPFNQSPIAVHYSLLAIRHSLPFRHSLFAAVEPEFLARFQNCFT